MLNRSFNEKSYQIDKKIFDALLWLSDSLKNFIIPHKVVGLITSLEVLLTGSKMADSNVSDKGISEMFSERGAIILYDTYEERLETKKELKEIYGLRSKIVHGGVRGNS